ncbi:MAG TPA: type II toxin-antitoxin system RelE/ParE family toxin [Acidobacteriota bacterium]|nr:type II toxin-antitoxin system RelE/ParE family toxin [Acidobacteriota bacterium]
MDGLDTGSVLWSCAETHSWLTSRGQEGIGFRADEGESIGMPDVRPMPTVGRQASGIRISEKSGSYRAFFAVQTRFGILLFHAFRKKSKKRPPVKSKRRGNGLTPF